jgi:5-hydroxyisourate hydrolase
VAKARATISTHVLDLETGAPAVSFPVALFRLGDDGQPELLTEAETDGDGRVSSLVEGPLRPGSYQLIFDVAAYLDGTERDPTFFENMVVGFRIEDVQRGYHVPLLLTPFGLSTYRGS